MAGEGKTGGGRERGREGEVGEERESWGELGIYVLISFVLTFCYSYLSLVGGLGMVGKSSLPLLYLFSFFLFPYLFIYLFIVGPMVGGYFAKPADKYPTLFPPDSFFDKFPYLLPSLVSAVLNIILFILSYLYL